MNSYPKIIIDSGHGGKDNGGGNNDYWLEKNFNLDISLYQFKRLTELNFNVILTRNKDEYISPSKRTRIVRNSKSDLCISNHINAGGGEGVETIHSIYDDGVLSKEIFLSIIRKGQIGRRCFDRVGNNGKDYYYMHRDTGKVKTIIVEYGFADNPKDTKRLLNNWELYAEAVVEAICKYYEVEYKPPIKEHLGKKYKDYLTKEKGFDIREERFNDNITRAEAFKLIAIATGYKEKGE